MERDEVIDMLSKYLAPISGNITEICKNHSLAYVGSTASWALKMRDATAKPSSGLFVGDPVFLGNFDECLSVRDARYCLATLHLRTTETSDVWRQQEGVRTWLGAVVSKGLRWGFCSPLSCSAQDVRAGLSDILQQKFDVVVDMDCHLEDPKPFGAVEWISAAILLLLLLLVVLSSAREMYKDHKNNGASLRDNRQPIRVVRDRHLGNVTQRGPLYVSAGQSLIGSGFGTPCLLPTEATTTSTTLSNAVQALIRIQQTPQTALEAPVTEGRRQSRTPISSDTPEKLSALLQTKKETSLNTYNHEAKMPRSGIKLKINNPPSLTEQPALSLRKSGSESRAEEPRRLLPISEETQLVPDFGSIHPQSERPQSPARKNTMHYEFSTSSKEEEFNSINITRVEKTECPTEPQRVDSKRSQSPFELDDVLLSQDSNKVVNITGKLETGANVLIEAKIPLAIAEESPSSAQQESEPRKKSSQSTESSSTNSPYKSMSSSEDSFYSLTETEADIAQFGIESQVGDSVRSQLPSELHEASVLLQESNKGAIRKRKSNSNDKFLSEAKLPSPTSEDGSESDLSASQPIETLPTMSLWRGDSSNMHKLPYVSEEDFHSDSGLESGKTTSEIESRDFGLYDSPSELGAASISLQKHIALKRKEQTNGSKILHRPEQRPPSPIQEDFYQIQGTSDPRFGGSQPTELPARLLAREESSNTESLLLKVSSELEKREWTSGSNSRPGSSSELLSNSDPVNQSQLSNESNSDGVTPVAQVEEITSLLPQQSSSSRTTPSRYPSPSDFDIDAVPEGNISTIRTVDPDPYEADPYDPEADIWAAFSLISNSRRILIVDEPTCLPSVDGIKVLSLLWVMLIHTCFLTANLPTVNYLNITAFASHLFSTIIINASLAADTFMVTSGVLISYAFLKDMANKGFYQHEGTKLSWKFLCRYLPTYYTARYIRYLPTVSLMVLLQITFVSYLGSGPLWDYATGHMTEICRETWWSTLLMCQNLIDPAKICVWHSWYLMVDMQLYMFSPLLLLFLLTCSKVRALVLIVYVIIMGIVSSFLFNFSKMLPAGLTTGSPSEWVLKNRYDLMMPFTRLSPWTIGVAVGYLIFSYRKENVSRISWYPIVMCFCWLLAALSSGYALFGINPFLQLNHQSGTLESALYSSVSHTLWALGTGWIIFACELGHGGLVKTVLTWKVFQHLSRLSFCVFVVHLPLMTTRASTIRTPVHFNGITAISSMFEHIALSIVLALPFFLFVQQPFIRIFKYFTSKC
ncbi:uncharacterized protein [Periplaneta americana]|uniref:uncharacterized protein n=1 Tax=Periplaneta americana TaxID=6978 RepID=UPI0037E7BDD2